MNLHCGYRIVHHESKCPCGQDCGADKEAQPNSDRSRLLRGGRCLLGAHVCSRQSDCCPTARGYVSLSDRVYQAFTLAIHDALGIQVVWLRQGEEWTCLSLKRHGLSPLEVLKPSAGFEIEGTHDRRMSSTAPSGIDCVFWRPM